MSKKHLVPVIALSLVVMSSSLHSEAQEPIYDQDGNLILDMEQQDYSDMSSDVEVPQLKLDSEETKIILDEPQETQNHPSSLPKISQQETTKRVTATEPTTETVSGYLTPASSTYMANSNSTITAKGNLNIIKVEVEYAQGLPVNSWSVVGKDLTFDKSKLNTATSGIYSFKVYFENGTDTIFELKVLDEPKVNDYWQQNITSYSKDPRSNTHRDLELISSSTSLKVSSVTIGGVSVPSSQYSVIAGTIIISQGFLSKLDSSERSRVTVTYNDGLVVDFSLAITDEVEKGNSSEQVDC